MGLFVFETREIQGRQKLSDLMDNAMETVVGWWDGEKIRVTHTFGIHTRDLISAQQLVNYLNGGSVGKPEL